MSWQAERFTGEPTEPEIQAQYAEDAAEGADAFAEGEPRQAPASWSAESRRAWFDGYDAARQRAEDAAHEAGTFGGFCRTMDELAEWAAAPVTVRVSELQLVRAAA